MQPLLLRGAVVPEFILSTLETSMHSAWQTIIESSKPQITKIIPELSEPSSRVFAISEYQEQLPRAGLLSFSLRPPPQCHLVSASLYSSAL